MQPIVIKLSGHQIDDEDFLIEFAQTIRQMNEPVVIVHGGGKEITQLQKALHIETKYVDGVRVTDEESLAIVEMVLSGVVNKRLVRHLVEAGLEAMGLSGVDRGMIRAVKMLHPDYDMQFTGSVTNVRGEVILGLLKEGITPVVSPVCLAADGQSSLNVNGDHVAGALGAAINAERVVFISNVEGVLSNGQIIPNLTTQEALNLIDTGIIFGGMIPKIQTALELLEHGVSQVVITNLDGLKSHGGTVFTSQKLVLNS